MTAFSVQETSLENVLEETMVRSLEGLENRITTRVHHLMRENSQAEEASEGHVPAPGVSTSVRNHQAALAAEHVDESTSSSAGSGRRNWE